MDKEEHKMRIVQELVPGKQITIAHIIANPDESIFNTMGLNGCSSGAIGIITMSPAETAVIAADIGIKAAGVKVGYVNYHDNGTLIVTGSVSEVQSALSAILGYCGNKLGFEVCEITKT